jgi:hypothetical protein
VATQQWVLHICYDLFDCENCHTQSKYVEFN